MSLRRREGPFWESRRGTFYFDMYVGFPPNQRRVRKSLKTSDPKKARWLWEQEYRREWEAYYGGQGSGPTTPPPALKDLAEAFVAYERDVKHISEWKMYQARLRIIQGILGPDMTIDKFGLDEIREMDKALTDRMGKCSEGQDCLSTDRHKTEKGKRDPDHASDRGDPRRV